MKKELYPFRKISSLIEINFDAYQGFMKAAENTDDKILQSNLLDIAMQRLEFAHQLSKNIETYDTYLDTKSKGSVKASFHRIWIDLITMVSSEKDKAILQECIRGLQTGIIKYEEYLEKFTFSAVLTCIIENQLKEIKAIFEKLTKLEDAIK